MADGVRARVPARVARLTDKIQNTYAAYVDHAVQCGPCRETGGRCDEAEVLWDHYREARREANNS